MSNLIFIKDNDNNVGIGSNIINDIKGNINITQNLNVEGNLNINKIAINGSLGNSGEVLKSTGNGLEWGTGGTAIDLSSSTGIGTKLISGDQLILGNSPIGLNLNFSGNNLHINGNVPKAGQVLVGTGSEIKWADTDNSLINNQLIKVVTETASDGIFKKVLNILHLNSGVPNYTETYTVHNGYILNQETKKIIIIVNFALYINFHSNLTSQVKVELLINNNIDPQRTIILEEMFCNRSYEYTKYFSVNRTDFTGALSIHLRFSDMNNLGNIKLFTNDKVNIKQPIITLQEIGDRTVKAILDETRGSKSDQIAKVLVNTNANVTTTQLLDTSHTHLLHGDYTPSVSDTGTIIIIVNFALHISFNDNLTSEVKLELLINNNTDSQRTIILQEMCSNKSYEYTKYFSISKTAFGTNEKIELRFTDMNSSGNIRLFTNDNSPNPTVKQPTVTIQEIGTTTGWGTTINDIPIGQTTSADGSFNKVVVKHNLDVSGNLNIIGTGIINTSLGIGTTSLNNGFSGPNVHTNSILDINGQTTIRGHILPSQNAQFDLGNAEYKIRHLFLSDNSLWIGDDHKIDISGGKMKFKKRNKTLPPQGITVNDVKSILPVTRANQINGASDVKLSEWYKYADSIGIGTTIFKSNDPVWEENNEIGSSTWIKNGNDITYTDGKIGIGTNNPATDFEVKGNFNLTTIQPGVATGISITNRNKKRWGIRIPGTVYDDDNSKANVDNGIAVGSLENNPAGTPKVRAAYIPDSNMARYLGMTEAALNSAKNGETAIDVDVYDADGVFKREDNIIMSSSLETAAANGGSNSFPILKNSDESAKWLPDEYIRGRNINPIGSYVGIGTTNSDYELSVHGQIYILGTSHPRAGFGGEDAWPLKINLDGNSEMNSVRDPTKTTDWVALGAAGFGGSGQHDYRRTATSPIGAAIGTGLNALYFITNKREPTGYVNLGPGAAHNNLLSFTGQHRNVSNNIDIYNNIDNYIGYIVYSTGNYKTYNYGEKTLKTGKNAITINDSLPEIALSNKKKQKSVFGIISNKEEENRSLSIGNFHTPYPNINDDKRLYVNSMGEGAIWIVNTNGNLENGDYIQSSDVIGMGEKQDDDFLHNYTVAKITCDCNFELNTDNYECIEFVDATSGNTYKKAFVGCTYHCG